MSEQPSKTKQELLAELESIMSMLDEDAVIPVLETVVEDEDSHRAPEPPAQADAFEAPEFDPSEFEISSYETSTEEETASDSTLQALAELEPDFGAARKLKAHLDNPFLSRAYEASQPSLLKGEKQAEPPLPGQQHLFIEGHDEQEQDVEINHSEADKKPENPFKQATAEQADAAQSEPAALDLIVDQLVAEYLPKLEAELRQRLLRALDTDQEL
ncbi:MAG: hypothetical protein OIF38_03695 [Cellvibrionaceae bacterium]|nr:hypothetical protein [Cellvibrionaceae bacterium]